MHKPAPVPLFNYKKRPRQALVSDPGQVLQGPNSGQSHQPRNCDEFQGAGNTNAEDKYDKSKIGSNTIISTAKPVSCGNMAKRQTQAIPGGRGSKCGLMDMKGKFGPEPARTSGFPLGSSFGGDGFHDASTSGRYNKQETAQGTTFSRAPQCPSGSHPSGQRGGRFPHHTWAASSPTIDQFHGGRGSGGINSTYNNRENGGSKFSRGGVMNKQQGSSSAGSDKQFSFSRSFTSATSGLAQSPASNQANCHPSNRKSSWSNTKPVYPTAANDGAHRGRGAGNTSGRTNQIVQQRNPHSANTASRDQDLDANFEEETNSGMWKPMQDKVENKRRAAQSSMRIFTCSIASLKSWATLRLTTGIVMFEVYGVLDSATVRDPTGTGKEFVLRDDTASIKCVFYEIDRELPRLTRGQVHRVVGQLDQRRGLLKVVSVRRAQREERAVCQLASAASQQEMEALHNASHEQ